MKKLLFFCFCALTSVAATAQNIMVVEQKSGTTTEYNVDEIQRVYFKFLNNDHITCPDNNHPHMIDLGLPSGTKWACCNVGSSSPEDNGGYYAWGETFEKTKYSWDTYTLCNGSRNTCFDLGDIAGTEYDVAHVLWGEPWTMPSNEQYSELVDNCSFNWIKQNGVVGAQFTGKNGGTIFFPTAGHRYEIEGSLNGVGSWGDYRTSSQNPNSICHDAYYICFFVGEIVWLNSSRSNDTNRCAGRSVRPVMKNTEEGATNADDGDTKIFTINGVSFKMVKVEGGTFTMGNKSGYHDERIEHQVTLDDYYIGETEVSQELWTTVMGGNPSQFKGAKLPVETVSWDDCVNFIAKLNSITGMAFRLPTEAEWEFAARGGNKSRETLYSGSENIDDVAWYSSNSGNTTQEVASKHPNELGIYDMTGNVWEWSNDFYSSSYSSAHQKNPAGAASGTDHVTRGNAWNGSANFSRVFDRGHSKTSYKYYDLGLRLALSNI